MNNNNFEQQFIQNIKSNASPVEQNAEQKHNLFAILIVVIIFIGIQLILSIAILININSSSGYKNEEVSFNDEPSIDENEGTEGVYDNNDCLIAMDITCASEDGVNILLTKRNTYQKLDANSTILDKGSYAITRGSVFKFADSNKDDFILFYDGYTLTDGTTFYDCEATTIDETPSAQ